MQAQVPERVLYAVVQDQLLRINANKYYSMSYLTQIDIINPGVLSPSEWETQRGRIITLYERARERFMLKCKRYLRGMIIL